MRLVPQLWIGTYEKRWRETGENTCCLSLPFTRSKRDPRVGGSISLLASNCIFTSTLVSGKICQVYFHIVYIGDKKYACHLVPMIGALPIHKRWC